MSHEGLVRLPPPFDKPLSEWSVEKLREWRGRLLRGIQTEPMTDALKAEMAMWFNAMARELDRRGLVNGEFSVMDIGLKAK